MPFSKPVGLQTALGGQGVVFSPGMGSRLGFAGMLLLMLKAMRQKETGDTNSEADDTIRDGHSLQNQPICSIRQLVLVLVESIRFRYAMSMLACCGFGTKNITAPLPSSTNS